MTRRLDGKVALVSGASRGIGRAIALAYAAEGAAVALGARSAADLNRVRDEAAASNGDRAIALPTDATSEQDVQRLVDATVSAFDRCDVLVNVAGINGPVAEVADLSLDAFVDGIRGNLLGPFLFSRAVIPVMRQQRSGRIMNVASGLAIRPQPGLATYSTAKAGIVQLSRVLAEELAPWNIQVNAVQPGFVRTALIDELIELGRQRVPSVAERLLDLDRTGQFITPEQCTPLFLFLASPEAADITGQFVLPSDPAIKARLAAFA